MAEQLSEYRWQRSIKPVQKRMAWIGYAVLISFTGTFVAWAATAPISGAALAPGTIAAAGRNIVIQHLEGGIVAGLPVKEGDLVEAGDVLLVIEPTQARTQLDRLEAQRVTNEAMIARLTAERDGLSTMEVQTNEVLGSDRAIEAYDEQRKEFEARFSRYRSEQEILRQRVTTLDEARAGLEAQESAVDEQLSIVSDELRRKKSLVDQGLTNHFEYTQILRNQADLIGQRGVIASEKATTSTQRLEALEQRERLATQRVEQAVTRLNEIRAANVDVEEQIAAARFVLERTDVRAPAKGIVVASSFNAIGSVVPPGGQIMEILPTTDGVLVEARVSPADVDVVKVGQAARLRLSSLNQRVTPEVAGHVTHISADNLLDEATQQTYYLARIRINDDLPLQVSVDQLYPGMPVEAYISTGDRTFFEYLAKPVVDSFSRAFVED